MIIPETPYILFLLFLLTVIIVLLRLRKTEKERKELLNRNKELEAELAKQSNDVVTALNELESVNATKNKFLSIIAHDLRNPFNHMLGFAHLLTDKDSGISCEEKEVILDELHKSLKNAYKLLEDLLTWADSQSNRIIVNPIELKLNLVIQQVIQNLSAIIIKKKMIIECDCPDDLWVYADKELLSTILRNLINNAIKFSNEKSQVTITAEPKNEMVVISVIDSGVGIPEENQSKIFVMEDRLSTRGTKDEAGTGLGLSLCKEFVHLCKGEIEFESKVGEGTKFFFSIPQIFIESKS